MTFEHSIIIGWVLLIASTAVVATLIWLDHRQGKQQLQQLVQLHNAQHTIRLLTQALNDMRQTYEQQETAKQKALEFLKAAGIDTRQPIKVEKDSKQIEILYQAATTNGSFVAEHSGTHCWDEVYRVNEQEWKFIGIVGEAMPMELLIYQ